MCKVVFAKKANKQKSLLKAAGLDRKTKNLFNILAENPFQTPPSYEKLTGGLQGCYSRRINIQHHLVYSVQEEEKTVIVRSMWTHY
jgi:Txe/YoeB family toxin of toxin-antitoxin system